MELVSVSNNKGSVNNLQVARLPPLDKSNRYTLSNNAIAHSIPPIGALNSGADHQSGVIDTWPAHSTNQKPSNIHLSLNKFNNLVLTNLRAEGKADATPKPKFLDNLEKFVSRELKALGCNSQQRHSASNEARLQAYREAFEYLLEEFKTYKPILSMIKNEYEIMLAAQREKIRELEPLKQMLVTLADQCDYKLMQYREEEKAEIKQLKEDKRRQMDEIMELKNGKQMLQIQVEKLQTEMGKEHERFRNEQDKRKLLILDLNDLRFQQEEAKLAEMKRDKKRMAEGLPDDEDTQDDPVTLKIALRMCRRNLNDAMKRLTKMEADYGDVVPRRDYEQLKLQHDNLVDASKEMKDEFSSNKKELFALKESYRNLENKFADSDRQLDEYRRDCTPRPDWDRCTTLIDAEKWSNLIDNKTSVQILETFVYELGGKKDGAKMTEYHTAMGSGPEVPAHLRTDGNKGQVKKISVSKRDMCLIIKDLWKQREGQANDLSEFMIKFLRKRYNTDMMAFEYSYAMVEAFESKNLDSEYLVQFAGVLSGRLDEDIFNVENRLIKKLLDSLKETEKSENVSDDSVSRAGFIESIKGLFKYLVKKNSDFVDGLVKSVEEELGVDSSAERFEYKALFVEDFKDKHGLFINALRGSFKEERALFANKIKEQAVGKGQMTVNDLKLGTKEEGVTDKDLEGIVKWVFKGEKQIDSEIFNKRIENIGYYPVAV